MEGYKKRLEEFIINNDPTKEINRLMRFDSSIKFKWEKASSNKEWRDIKSSKDVEVLIKYFKTTVEESPKEICLRNMCIDDILIAQYKAVRGLKRWLNNDNQISILRSKEFSKLTEEIVSDLINKMNSIIDKI